MQFPPHIEDYLQQTNICVFATTGPADRPHAIPMWYLYRDGTIIITTSSRSQKYKNVERTGKAVIVVDRREPPYFFVSVSGDAVVGPPLSRDEEYGVASRYLSGELLTQFMQHYDSGAGDDATIVITPTRFFEYAIG